MERAIIRKSEPPSPRSRFLVGRDAQGCWVVRDRKGLVGGLFADREAAVHFAMVESDRVPGAVSCAPDDAIISLDAGLDRPSRWSRH
jgi:hypothetical protein